MGKQGKEHNVNAPATRVLLTGGAGHIGSHLAELLVARGDAVTIVDDLSTGRLDNLVAVNGRVTFIRRDLSDALDHELADTGPFDEIYHLAAAVGVDLVLSDPIRAIDVNVHATSKLLRYALDHGSPATLIASSSEVYGKPGTAVFSEDDDSVYGSTTTTRWSYACSKALDEHLALAYYRHHGLPAVIARFFNTVGPRQLGSYGMVLPRFVQAAVAGEPLRVFGDGQQSRCFCDVRDSVDALPRLLAHPTCHGRIFNLGSDEPITIMALAELVIDTLQSSSTIEKIPYADAYPEGFEDLRQRRPDLTRIRDTIGFQPEHALERTILDLAAAMRDPKIAKKTTNDAAERTGESRL